MKNNIINPHYMNILRDLHLCKYTNSMKNINYSYYFAPQIIDKINEKLLVSNIKLVPISSLRR